MSGKALPIQHLYCSQADYSQICKVTVEAIDAPTTPLIHQMSRFWLFTGGRGTIVLQDRQMRCSRARWYRCCRGRSPMWCR